MHPRSVRTLDAPMQAHDARDPRGGALVNEWTILELEPAAAARSGLPERVAVPVQIAAAREELDRQRVAGWAGSFAQEHPAHPLADVSLRLAQAEPYRRLGMRLLQGDRLADAVR